MNPTTNSRDDNSTDLATSGAPVRHILSLSGGKDSTALAIYLRDRVLI